MSTQLTEMVAKISADSANITSALEGVKRQVRDVGTASAKAGAVSGSAFDAVAQKVDKVAKASGAALNAIYALEAKGSARVLALGNAVGNVAGLFGPQGKMVQGVAIVGSAIAALLLQAREQSAATSKAILADIRSLERAGDLAALARRKQQLFSGDKLFDDADRDPKQTKAIQDGGLQKLAPLVSKLRGEIKDLEFEKQRALQNNAGRIAVEEYNRQLAVLENQLKPIARLHDELKAEYDGISISLDNVTAASIRKDQTLSKIDADKKAAQLAEQLTDKLRELSKRLEDLKDSLAQASPSEKFATDLKQLVDAYELLGSPIRKVQLRLAELNTTVDAQGRVTADAQREIDALRSKYGSTIDKLAELQELQEQLAGKEAGDKTKGVTSALEEQNETVKARLTLWVKEAEARDAANRQSANVISDLDREAAAILQGTEAYAAFQRELAATTAVRAAQERATTEGRKLTPKEIDTVRDNALKLFDAGQNVAVALQTMKDAAEGGLLKAFSELAQQATSIATSLGDAGKNIAQIAAIAGPLFSGFDQLTKGLQLRDKLGNIVKGADGKTQSNGFLYALRGKNGSESQAQALTGALAIVGAVASVADALDLFGTRAKAKAQAVQAALREFTKGLEDFAAQANPLSGASEAIKNARRRAEELANQAFAAGGGSFTFSSEVTVAELQNVIDILRASAAEIGNLGGPISAIADSFEDLAAVLEKAEEAAREQVRRNIEDLNVRRLYALGLTAEANALRVDTEQRRELLKAQNDVTEEGRRYYFLLLDTLEVEKQRAYLEEQRNAAFQLLDDSIAVFGGSGVEVLKSTYNTIKQLFPQFAGLFDGLDLSTTEGLSSAKDKLQDLFRELTADGIITDAERPIVEAIKRLLGNIEAAFGELTDPLAAALDVFSVRVEVFGLSLAEQFDELATILGNAFPEISELLSGAGGGSLEDIKTSIQARIAALLEGGIDESEVPLLAALQQLLANIVGQIDEAAQEAEEAARAAEQARQERVNRANRTLNAEIQLGGLSGADALQARVRSVAAQSPILAQLLPLFGDTSAAGIRATKDALFALFRDIDAGRVPIEMFGDLTEDEIIAKIIELNGNLDELAESLTDAAKAAAEAAEAERQATTDLRTRLAKSRGEDTRLLEFDVAASREREAAQAAGRSAAFLQFLDQVLVSERSKLLADIAGEAVTASLNAAADVAKSNAGKSQTTEITRTVGSLTEVTGQTLAGYLRSIDQNTRTSANADLQISQLLSGMRAPGSIPIPALPNGSTGGGRGGQTIIFNVAAPTLNLPVTASPDEVGRAIGDAQVKAISERISQFAQTDVRHLGRFDV